MVQESPFRTIVLALAIVLAGWLIAGGIVRFRQAERYVTVKGVAERDIVADVGVWPIRFTAANDDLDLARQKVENDRKRVVEFLGEHGIDADKTELQSLEVQDARANPYQSQPGGNRYIVTATILARDEPDRIKGATQAVSDLVAAGVVFSSGSFTGGPTYLFTRLNDYKPEMVAEATRNAREAAAEFARESKARVGSIRRARQGAFQILPRDPAPGITEASQVQKRLRVVATMDFFLK